LAGGFGDYFWSRFLFGRLFGGTPKASRSFMDQEWNLQLGAVRRFGISHFCVGWILFAFEEKSLTIL
jgi:hypothetical protein